MERQGRSTFSESLIHSILPAAFQKDCTLHLIDNIGMPILPYPH